MGDRQQAVNLYNQAITVINDKANPSYLTMAYQLFAAAVIQDPTYATGWYQLGNNNSDLKKFHAAVANWRRAIEEEADPQERGRAYSNMAWRLHTLGKTTEALEMNDKAAAEWPGAAFTEQNYSIIWGQAGDSKKSVEHARKAHALDPGNSEFSMVLAFALLFDGQYKEGFELFENRFKWQLTHFMHYPYTKWDGKGDGKTIVLAADQGLGDTLSFARFVPALAKRCKHVYVLAQQELLGPFMHMFARLPNVDLFPNHSQFPPADAWTSFVSLPYVLGLSDQEVRDAPFGLDIPRHRILSNWKVSDRKFHIGIAWGGSSLNPIDAHRNIPLHYFYELYRVPGVQLYSLQIDRRKEELAESGSFALIRDLSPYILDIGNAASVIDQLDLVISVESALGHICSAIGRECWIPYSYLGRDYRAGLKGEKKLWAPQHKFFQQGPEAAWEPVFETIVKHLKHRVEAPEEQRLVPRRAKASA